MCFAISRSSEVEGEKKGWHNDRSATWLKSPTADQLRNFFMSGLNLSKITGGPLTKNRIPKKREVRFKNIPLVIPTISGIFFESPLSPVDFWVLKILRPSGKGRRSTPAVREANQSNLSHPGLRQELNDWLVKPVRLSKETKPSSHIPG